MVMLKILKQYYQATEDKRVITLLTNYFKYQLKDLPVNKLDHWTFWARYREADNLAVVYWLYNITGDKYLRIQRPAQHPNSHYRCTRLLHPLMIHTAR